MATPLHEHELPTTVLPAVSELTVVLDPRADIAHTQVLPSLEHLQMGPHVVGHAALNLADRVAGLAAPAGNGGIVTGRDIARVEAAGRLQQELDRNRQALGGLDFRHQMLLDEYLDACVRRATEDAGADMPDRRHNTWAGWLSEAEDSFLLDVMAAHENLLGEQTLSPEVAKAVATEKNDFIAGVAGYIARARLHPEATAAIVAAKSTDVRLGDPWDTWVLGAAGYHMEGGENEVVLAQSIAHTEAQRERDNIARVAKTLPHELGHLKFAHGWSRWRTEAAVEHITASMKYGNFESVGSENRGDRSQSYIDERLLMHALLTLGRNQVSPALLTRAASAQSERARVVEDAHLGDTLDASWGIKNVLGKVDRHVVKAEAWLARTRPELNEQDVQKEALRIALAVLERESVKLHGTA